GITAYGIWSLAALQKAVRTRCLTPSVIPTWPRRPLVTRRTQQRRRQATAQLLGHCYSTFPQGRSITLRMGDKVLAQRSDATLNRVHYKKRFFARKPDATALASLERAVSDLRRTARTRSSGPGATRPRMPATL